MDEMTARSQLVTYVEMSRKAGKDDQTIRHELTMAGWESAHLEQWWPVAKDLSVVDLERLAAEYTQKKPRRSMKLVLGMGVVLFLLMALLGLWAGMVYGGMKFPGISESWRNRLIMAGYRLPLPKTAEQVLLAAVSTDQTLTTYTPDFSVSMNMGQTVIPLGAIELALKGPVDFTDPINPKLDVHVDLGINFGGSLYKLGATVRKPNEMVYFKLDAPSDSFYAAVLDLVKGFSPVQSDEIASSLPEIKSNIAEVLANWVSYDTKGLDSEASAALRSKDQSLVDTTRENIQSTMLASKVLPEVKLIGSEEIEGTSTYHLQLIPSSEAMASLAQGYLSLQKDVPESDTKKFVDAITSGIEHIEINAWFGSDDAILRKVVVTSRVNLANMKSFSSLQNGFDQEVAPLAGYDDLFNEKLNLSYVLVLRDIGKSVVVEKPEQSISVIEFGGQLTNAFQTQAQRDREMKKAVLDSDLSALHKALFVHYAEYGAFPEKLVDLDSGLTDDVVSRIPEYTYRVSANGSNFVLYTPFEANSGTFAMSASPFYGITGDYAYPHSLSLDELE